MLDWVGYSGPGIIRRHFMDNSCGAGAFLLVAVERYILAAFAGHLPLGLVKKHLATYIHGIEIDADACERCISSLDTLAQHYGIRHVRWDIRQADALGVSDFDGRMDFVVGNPPYVRNHNVILSDDVRNRYSFIQLGNADLYLAFFQLGFRMLSPEGRMCYITPVSWVYSKSGSVMRQYLASHSLLAELVDMGHYQVFPGISTYTVVTLFTRAGANKVTYSVFDESTWSRRPLSCLPTADCLIDGRFYFGTPAQLDAVRQIRQAQYPRHFIVKNGFATLADSLFFNVDVPSSTFTIPVLKASRGVWYNGFFPYDASGRPITEDELHSSPEMVAYLDSVKSALVGRDFRDGHWWHYGRTQAVCDVYKPRMAVNSLVRDKRDLRVVPLPPGTGVYNGFYVLSDNADCLSAVGDLLLADAFLDFIRMLRIYKSGGWYEFRAKDLEQYLNYAFSCRVPK